eukprot:760853-Hanusia_phi.AAC.6
MDREARREENDRTEMRSGLWRQGKAKQGKAKQGKARQGKRRGGKAREEEGRQGQGRGGEGGGGIFNSLPFYAPTRGRPTYFRRATASFAVSPFAIFSHPLHILVRWACYLQLEFGPTSLALAMAVGSAGRCWYGERLRVEWELNKMVGERKRRGGGTFMRLRAEHTPTRQSHSDPIRVPVISLQRAPASS